MSLFLATYMVLYIIKQLEFEPFYIIQDQYGCF